MSARARERSQWLSRINCPAAEITAIDLSEAALAVARDNAQRNGVDGRIRFLQGDLLAPIAGEQFDIVVSNPPYVATSDRGSLSVEVREYEPELALFAGEDGLDVYRRLIPAAYRALVRGVIVVLEIGYAQAEAIRGLMAAAGFEKVEFIPDLAGYSSRGFGATARKGGGTGLPFGFVVSHLCDRKKSQGWGTGVSWRAAK